MGTSVHIVMLVGSDALADWAVERIHELESLWSRFRPDSEVSRLNALTGNDVVVSLETFELVQRSIDAWKLTGCRFDPTVYSIMMRSGYDRSFELLAEDVTIDDAIMPASGCAAIQLDATQRVVRLPRGVGFDPGGIGKGLAADFVVEELIDIGADGALVNIGGDVRFAGVPPSDDGWRVAVQAPDRPDLVSAVLAFDEGAVVTSTRLMRRWRRNGVERHHLVDPATGESPITALESVTVISSEGWRAEAVAKAAFLAGPDHALEAVALMHMTGLVTLTGGRVRALESVRPYLAMS
jgi:thiamine biosynthesis lipoprotein